MRQQRRILCLLSLYRKIERQMMMVRFYVLHRFEEVEHYCYHYVQIYVKLVPATSEVGLHRLSQIKVQIFQNKVSKLTVGIYCVSL